MKPSKKAILEVINPYIIKHNGMDYIIEFDKEKAIQTVMSEIENVYCGIEATSTNRLYFIVNSAKRRHEYLRMPVLWTGTDKKKV